VRSGRERETQGGVLLSSENLAKTFCKGVMARGGRSSRLAAVQTRRAAWRRLAEEERSGRGSLSALLVRVVWRSAPRRGLATKKRPS
jgi:hypothetical protein